MGLDYSFRFVAPRDRANALLAAVADQALDEHAQQLRKALPWAPQSPHTAEAWRGRHRAGLCRISKF